MVVLTLRWLLWLPLAVLLFADDGTKEGRAGNAAYDEERYEDAAAAYRAGIDLAATTEPVAPAYGQLLNNLGAALYRSESYQDAQEAFSRSARVATSEADRARAAYNAGNTAVRLQDPETALAYYRDALLADPGNEDAKVNYELVKRQLEQEQQNQEQDGEQDSEQPEDGEEGDEQQNQQGQQDQQGEQEQQQGEQDANQQGQDETDPNQQSEEQQQGESSQESSADQPPSEAQPDPTQLSEAEAQRILQALQNEESELLREVMKAPGRARRVEKDW